MILFISTRTTSPDPEQSHLIHLAALLCESDGRRVRELNRLIIPDGWTIPPDVATLYRVNTTQAATFGTPLGNVLCEFQEEMAERLIGTKGQLAAFGIDHHLNVIRKAYRDTGYLSFPALDTIPTKDLTPIDTPEDDRTGAMSDVLLCRETYLDERTRWR